jgi:hypothetical protein
MLRINLLACCLLWSHARFPRADLTFIVGQTGREANAKASKLFAKRSGERHRRAGWRNRTVGAEHSHRARPAPLAGVREEPGDVFRGYRSLIAQPPAKFRNASGVQPANPSEDEFR